MGLTHATVVAGRQEAVGGSGGCGVHVRRVLGGGVVGGGGAASDAGQSAVSVGEEVIRRGDGEPVVQRRIERLKVLQIGQRCLQVLVLMMVHRGVESVIGGVRCRRRGCGRVNADRR